MKLLYNSKYETFMNILWFVHSVFANDLCFMSIFMKSVICVLQMSDEDVAQQVIDWAAEEEEEQRNEEDMEVDLSVGEEVDGNDVAVAGEKGRDVIDVDVEYEEEEGTNKREVQARSKIWEHFTKIKEKGVVVKGQCNYFHAEIKAHPALNGTFGMRKHFSHL
jgi:hypothetical protein